MPPTTLIWAGLIALSNWIALAVGFKPWESLSKPGVILALITGVILQPPFNHLLGWLGAALTLSLIGDIFLLFADRYFLPGLAAFFFAHVAYITAFNEAAPPSQVLWFILSTGILVGSGLFYRRLVRALIEKDQKKLLIPTLSYTCAISAFVISALSTLFRPQWQLSSALLVVVGGGLFYLSDAVLAWHRYISPVSHRDLMVRVPYHLGQMCLTWGAVLQSRV